MTTRIAVWNEQVEIDAYEKSSSVWIAVGYYRGERIEVKDRSRTSAITLWKKTAESRGT